jgi:hypothetical protein
MNPEEILHESGFSQTLGLFSSPLSDEDLTYLDDQPATYLL